MTHIPSNDRDLIELAIYLPMVLIILQQDRTIINNSPFKIKKPYLQLIDNCIENVHYDLYKVKKHMAKHNFKVVEIGRDESFTNYLFLYKGYEEKHNYFNPRIRNKVQQLLESYLANNRNYIREQIIN